MQWIIDNKEWLFGGIGVAILAAVLKLLFSKKSQSQKSGDRSTNIQAGGNVEIGRDISSGSEAKDEVK